MTPAAEANGAEVEVSVVIPAYRAAAVITRSVDSVRAQTGVRVECIVVVDGRFDDTAERLRDYPDVIVHTHEENQGAQRSRNAGLERARGEFVMFLDADDWLEGPILANAVRALRAKGADGAFADCRCIGLREGWMRVARTESAAELMSSWLRGGFVPPCAVLWRRSFVERIGGWNEAIIKNQDGELVYRALLQQPVLAFVEEGHGVYWDEDDATRLSQQVSVSVLANHHRIMTWLTETIPRHFGADSPVLRAVGHACYVYRRVAAKHGYDELYAQFTALQRANGFAGHVGPRGHQLASRLLGLYRKEWLVARARWLVGTR